MCKLSYVADNVITIDYETRIQLLKEHISQQFHTKDLGPIKCFLGIELAQSSSSNVINQHKNASDIGLLDCPPCNTTVDPNIKLLLS